MSSEFPTSLIHRRELLIGASALGVASLPVVACAQQAPEAPPARATPVR